MQRIRPWLCIGSYRDRQHADQLAAAGVGAMLQLAGLIAHPGIDSLALPIEGGW